MALAYLEPLTLAQADPSHIGELAWLTLSPRRVAGEREENLVRDAAPNLPAPHQS